ncbi:HNH endonuclease [Cryptosporangium phraense]|uniref:HNH endonuclease n=1 Tax=Cryptosporangium phraense TaxID=2593070 RepID=UPI00147944F7|nr:HNH endonuclease signature motif containing protein [Cryptosporangium phraense]
MSPDASTPDGPPDLPHPDSDEVRAAIKGTEAREAYRWLWENRDDPQPMAKWVEQSQGVFGKTNSNTGRRLREVYPAFVVDRFKQPQTGTWVYKLVSRREDAVDTAPISARLQAEVYTLKGRWCAMCGRGPADGVKLQIDHIRPREWGGETVLSNLEPLCTEHNHGKKAFFSSFDEIGPLIRIAMEGDDPWTRIGEVLKAFHEIGRPCPVSMISLVAQETHKGDPLKRLRELRYVLGWPIESRRAKDPAGITHVTYELTGDAPAWPTEGPQAHVTRYERERKARKRQDAREADV